MKILDTVCPECGLAFEVTLPESCEVRDGEVCPECGFAFIPTGMMVFRPAVDPLVSSQSPAPPSCAFSETACLPGVHRGLPDNPEIYR